MAELSDGITRFLPRYPNIVPDRDALFNPYDGDFYRTIYAKKEFYDLRLNETEEFPDRPGVLMNHQKIIARYLSSHTPYNGVLLFHEMGTGKTCSAVGAIEQVRSEGKFKGAIYIGSKVLSNTFLNELITTCTPGNYKEIAEQMAVPGERMTNKLRKMRYKRAVADYYKLGKDYTYMKFADRVKTLPLDRVRARYNNHIIVIDEVHNLSDTKESNNYNSIHKFLHQVQGCKILLLSGTPMRNKVSDIASVMNLILPIDQQLPRGQEFVRKYFTVKAKDLAIITPKGADVLARAFKGRVSYLRAATSDVERDFRGTTITVEGKKQYFKVSETVMSKFQTEGYIQAWEADGGLRRDEGAGSDQSGVYLNSRQASLFVYPDKSWGKKGFNTYIVKKKRKPGVASLFKRKRGSQAPQYVWSKKGMELKKSISRGELAKYSSKYAQGVEILDKAIEKKKLVFIYNEFIKGGGIILFSLILEALNYKKITCPNSKKDPDRKTFALLTGDTSNITEIIDTFNRADNYDGSRINVIIGSRVVAEGVSLANVQVEIMQTPWFNYARIDQALARGYRFGSHRVLKSNVDRKVVQDIYQQVAIPLSPDSPPSSPGSPLPPDRPPSSPGSPLPPPLPPMESIDMYMYRTAQKKDISFKKIENIMRSTAFDCALTYRRNRMKGVPNTRACNYTKCEYECIGVPSKDYESKDSEIAPKELDYSTYQLYYSNPKVQSLISRIVVLFKVNFILSLEQIQEDLILEDEDEFELLTALDSIASNSIPITNRYGFTSYLQEENNFYFLVDSLSTIGSSSMAYYTKYPNVKVADSFTRVREKYYSDVALPRAIRALCSARGELHTYIQKLPVEYREMFLEGALKVRELGKKGKTFDKKHIELSLKLLLYFKPDIRSIGDELYTSSLLRTHGGPLRCMDVATLKWYDCTKKEEDAFVKGRLRTRQRMEKEDFYGQLNTKDKEFCVRDMRKGTDVGGHQLTSGARCGSLKHDLLSYLATFQSDMPVPPSPATVKAILEGGCGPPAGEVLKPNKIKQVRRSWPPLEHEPLPKDDKKALQDFLLTSADRAKAYFASNKAKKLKGPSYDVRWFTPGTEIFEKVARLGGSTVLLAKKRKGKKGPLKAELDAKWKAVTKGIMKMTLPQMQRLIFYGTMFKETQCLFLCEWFKSKDLLLDHPKCGHESKKKPKG